MTTTDGQTVHPDTPDWFKPYWEANKREHDTLGKRIDDLRSNMPDLMVQALHRYHGTGGGNAYSQDPKEQ